MDNAKSALVEITSRPNAQWKYRRRIIYGTLIFCALNIEYILFMNTGSTLHSNAFDMLVYLAMSVISFYVFGATWDDKTRMGFLNNLATKFESLESSISSVTDKIDKDK